jgi:hypothetical protein
LLEAETSHSQEASPLVNRDTPIGELLTEIQTRLRLTEEYIGQLRTQWRALSEDGLERGRVLRQIEISAGVCAELQDLSELITLAWDHRHKERRIASKTGPTKVKGRSTVGIPQLRRLQLTSHCSAGESACLIAGAHRSQVNRTERLNENDRLPEKQWEHVGCQTGDNKR